MNSVYTEQFPLQFIGGDYLLSALTSMPQAARISSPRDLRMVHVTPWADR